MKNEPGNENILKIINPADGSIVGQIPAGTASDIDAAVEDASAALENW